MLVNSFRRNISGDVGCTELNISLICYPSVTGKSRVGVCSLVDGIRIQFAYRIYNGGGAVPGSDRT